MSEKLNLARKIAAGAALAAPAFTGVAAANAQEAPVAPPPAVGEAVDSTTSVDQDPAITSTSTSTTLESTSTTSTIAPEGTTTTIEHPVTSTTSPLEEPAPTVSLGEAWVKEAPLEELPRTGSNDALAATGVTLLGAGAAAMGAKRRLQNNQRSQQ